MDHAGRQQVARELMEREGVDVMLVAPNELNRVDTVFHLTGYRGVGESLAVMRKGEKPLLIVTPEWEIERAQARAKGWEVRGADNLPQAIATLFAKGLPAGRTATVNLGRLPAAIGNPLIAIVGKDAKKLEKSLEQALMPKTSQEVENARQATAIAEKGFDQMLKVAKVGMRECDLAVQMKLYMEQLGADDNFWLMTASPHNRAVQPSSGRKLEVGDIILAEMTPTYRGQLAQICRTAVMGPPSNLLSEKYALVVRAMEAGIRTIKPGIKMSTVANAIDEVLSAQGYAEYCRPAAYPPPRSWPRSRLQCAGRCRARERRDPARRHGLRRSPEPIPARDRLSALRRAGACDGDRRRAIEQAHGVACFRTGLRRREDACHQPAVLVGNYDWDEQLIPRGEYDARVKQVLAKLDPGLAGLVIYGNKVDNAALAYLTNFAPKIESGFALLSKDGKVRIHGSGSPQMMVNAKRLTWTEDVRPLRDPVKNITEWADEFAKGVLGLWATEAMPADLLPRIQAGLGERKLVDVSASLNGLLREKSPVALKLTREACGMLATAVATLKDRFHGESGREAAVAAEIAATRAGAQDIRILISLAKGGTPTAIDYPDGGKLDPLLAYIAVRHAGYWAEGAVTLTSMTNDSVVRTQARAESDAGGGEGRHDVGRVARCGAKRARRAGDLSGGAQAGGRRRADARGDRGRARRRFEARSRPCLFAARRRTGLALGQCADVGNDRAESGRRRYFVVGARLDAASHR